MWSQVGHTGHKWPTRSVERLPPFRPQKLRNQILVVGNTADPITPVASARFVVELLGDQAVLLEQLGFGHTTLAESSNCTDRIVADHVMRGIVSLFHVGVSFSLNKFTESRKLPAPTGEGDQVQGRQFTWTIQCSTLTGRRGSCSTVCSSASMKQGKRREDLQKKCSKYYSLQHSTCTTVSRPSTLGGTKYRIRKENRRR
jgi:hypothetical protein